MKKLSRILIIDDNRAVHEDFRKIFCPEQPSLTANDEAAFFGEEALPELEAASAELEFACQGEEGCALLERAVREDRAPAVAFLDVRMPPGMDGVETAARLWAISPELQIVLCTAYSDYSWEEMLARLPRRDRLLILKKPFAAIEALQLAAALQAKSTLEQQARLNFEQARDAVADRSRDLWEANHQLAVEKKRRIEAELNLFRAQQMESVKALASDIAHDLNNMLSPISFGAQLLHEEWPASTRKELVAIIEKSVERASGIVRQVLKFSRSSESEGAVS